MDKKIYENIKIKEGQEVLKEHKFKEKEKQLASKLTSKIKKIEEKLNKLPNSKDFFIRNINDYLKNKYGVKFEKAINEENEELVLVILDDKQNNLIKQLTNLADKLTITNNEIFIDENKDSKIGNNEIGFKLKQNELESNYIYVNKNEKDKNKKQVGFGKIKGKEGIINKEYTKGGKLISINGKDYYNVGKHGDYLAAPIRLFTALSKEYFDGMSAEELAKRIPKLGFKKGPNGYEFTKLTEENIKKGFKKVGDFNSEIWKYIVQPGSKINLTSLANALGTGKIESEKKLDTFKGWGRFYKTTNSEKWDIPDNWNNITYKGYSKTYNGLNGTQISIGAKNIYDFDNKKTGEKGKNTFSAKIEVDLGENNKGFLVIGETNNNELKSIINGKSKINKKDFDILKTKLQNSKTEAWFTQVELDKNGKIKSSIIEEIGDEKVHTITETTKKVERGKDKDQPIILNGNVYEFSGEINGKVIFKIENNQIKIKENKGLTIENFEKVFGAKKGYLLVNNYLVEIYPEGKEIKLKTKKLSPTQIDKMIKDNLVISNGLFSTVEFDKKTGILKFPEITGWGKINGKLEKIKDSSGKENVVFKLSQEYKIGGRQIIINISDKNKINPNDILEKTINGLLYIAELKDLKITEKKENIEITDKEIIIKTKHNISTDKLGNIITYEKEKKEKASSYIIDAIKEKFNKNNN